ncbi:RNA polymerase sigma factor [Mangrovibacterium diazotrophicum]|uniref:RNA polymerase sigma-70 factor (ECF subfamily) n=1 Tax=Mangrovibacterium diazotrophicum TaxID=1261403 RepID=A0A419W5T9_9BACT|nr:RNA polymerase sigma-70 factor [Mangrovibacterium diazotrophicum]RKD90833.1 RNA polymerase sigma-70 factor (ECF subfamily) [Mangrovibacterium diazotrophicum]
MVIRRNYEHDTDKVLFDLFNKKDDSEAYTELFNRYWEKLIFIAVQRLESEEEAEEIVQEVFIRLWERRGKIELKNSFHTYIASCIKYEIYSKLASKQKELHLNLESAALFASSGNTTEEWLNFHQVRQAIEESVKTLPEKCQLVFNLSRNEGYSQKQIASELNISTKTVESHISKALRTIKLSIQNFLFTLF